MLLCFRTDSTQLLAGILTLLNCIQWNLSDEARIVTASMFKTLAFAAETFLFAYIGLSGEKEPHPKAEP